MNESNLPENQLRSWRPRRPSAGLKRRIFRIRQTTPKIMVWAFRCLAPAAGCVLLAAATLNQGNGRSSERLQGNRMMAMLTSITSNQLAYLPGDYQQALNGTCRLTFEWTNRNGSTSSIGSFLPGKVN